MTAMAITKVATVDDFVVGNVTFTSPAHIIDVMVFVNLTENITTIRAALGLTSDYTEIDLRSDEFFVNGAFIYNVVLTFLRIS